MTSIQCSYARTIDFFFPKRSFGIPRNQRCAFSSTSSCAWGENEVIEVLLQQFEYLSIAEVKVWAVWRLLKHVDAKKIRQLLRLYGFERYPASIWAHWAELSWTEAPSNDCLRVAKIRCKPIGYYCFFVWFYWDTNFSNSSKRSERSSFMEKQSHGGLYCSWTRFTWFLSHVFLFTSRCAVQSRTFIFNNKRLKNVMQAMGVEKKGDSRLPFNSLSFVTFSLRKFKSRCKRLRTTSFPISNYSARWH